MTKFDQKSFTVVAKPQVSREEVARRWDETFGKKKPGHDCKKCEFNKACPGFKFCYLDSKK